MKKLLTSKKVILGFDVALSVFSIGTVVVHILKTGDLSALFALAVLLIGCPLEIVLSMGMFESQSM